MCVCVFTLGYELLCKREKADDRVFSSLCRNDLIVQFATHHYALLIQESLQFACTVCVRYRSVYAHGHSGDCLLLFGCQTVLELFLLFFCFCNASITTALVRDQSHLNVTTFSTKQIH